MVLASYYKLGVRRIMLGEIHLIAHTFSARLLTTAYTPNLDTHDDWADVSANEAAGTGYTAGGQALASKTVTFTAANSWATPWAASTAYSVGDVVRPTTGNGFLYRAVTAGSSAASEPTWPTVNGQDVTDGGVVWENVGTGIVAFDFTDPLWDASGGSLSAGYMVIVDDTHANDSLVALVDFEGEVTATNDTFTVENDPAGALLAFVA